MLPEEIQAPEWMNILYAEKPNRLIELIFDSKTLIIEFIFTRNLNVSLILLKLFQAFQIINQLINHLIHDNFITESESLQTMSLNLYELVSEIKNETENSFTNSKALKCAGICTSFLNSFEVI